jgi:hypothetical protein
MLSIGVGVAVVIQISLAVTLLEPRPRPPGPKKMRSPRRLSIESATTMAEFFPIRSSAAREPVKRPRPVPPKVRAAIRAMIYGAENDPAAKPLNLVEAAKAVGLMPYVLRRHFDRPQVLSLLRAERRVFRELLSSTNGYSLATIRVRRLITWRDARQFDSWRP